ITAGYGGWVSPMPSASAAVYPHSHRSPLNPTPGRQMSRLVLTRLFWLVSLCSRLGRPRSAARPIRSARGPPRLWSFLVMADIVLINPRFNVSYWGMEHALPLLGKRANLPVAALPLLAALTPAGHTVTLLDENVEPLDYDRLARADIVGVTGMSVQPLRMREILKQLKARGAFTVVGGPWVTVQEDYFGDLADVRFIGEAEQTWPQFLADWQAGQHAPRYEQAAKTDLTTVPTPRFDLLKMRHYLFGSVQ